MHLFSNYKDKLISFFDQRFTRKGAFVGDSNLLDNNYAIINKFNTNGTNQQLIKYSYLNNEAILEEFSSSLQGLTEDSAYKKINQLGFNEILADEHLSPYKHLWLSYKNPFNLLLSTLAIISYLTHDLKATIVISAMVLISTILRFVQERRSNSAALKLKEMVSTTVSVLRQENEDENDDIAQYERELKNSLGFLNSTRLELAIKELVIGDIIILSAGDMIPADLRILVAKDLFLSQASLTGESLPVEKFIKNSKIGINNTLELENIAFMGTNVLSGSATAIVIATGKNTLFGSLATKLIKTENRDTSFQKSVNHVSWLLIYFMLIMSPIVFIINGLSTHAWINAGLFAISVAVGLTPEMLPMIVTSTLAKGAVILSRKKVIVKHLDAIQNFGAMNILCTDKTGTLTQDKICLERHTDIFGNNCDHVLEYAYLNSYHQTGLKNLLDVAVLERNNFADIPYLVKKYHKIDEVPFDFKRRRMSVVVSSANEAHLLICKGAVEEMISVCTHASYNGTILPLNQELLTQLQKVSTQLNLEGLRVVAVAIKNYNQIQETYSVNDEQQMILIGYIAFLDPPKETTSDAIKALNRLGVEVKILTGDNELISAKVCREVGLNVEGMLLGYQLDNFSDQELRKISKNITVFAKLTPDHKERIVNLLKDEGHIVGFMGDGINDAPALRAADIGISVDSAVDIAKEAADIILLEKSLMILEQGVEEGRRTFANMLKYIKMTASSNFGNVFSVLIAAAFIPFLPMLPIQILLQNLIYDISQTVIPFDHVDSSFIMRPQRLNPLELRRFMIFFGPISSLFDLITFFILWHFYGANSARHQSLFQTGWFVEGLITQTMIVHMIRTRSVAFIQSCAAWPVIIMTILVVSIAIYLPFSKINYLFGMQKLAPSYFIFLTLIVSSYMILTQLLKGIYAKRFGW